MAFRDGHFRQESVSVGAVVEPHDGLVELGVEYHEAIGNRSYIEHGVIHGVDECFESFGCFDVGWIRTFEAGVVSRVSVVNASTRTWPLSTPHDSLDGLTPTEFRIQNDPATSNLAWH